MTIRFREMLRHYREAKDLSYRELSVLTGIESSAICRFELGKPLHSDQMASLFKWLLGVADDAKDIQDLQAAKEQRAQSKTNGKRK